MTGRKGRVVTGKNGSVQYELRSEREVPLELINIAEKKRFMDGEKVRNLWSDMSHKATARGALSKPSTGSGWAASFVVQLSSQL